MIHKPARLPDSWAGRGPRVRISFEGLSLAACDWSSSDQMIGCSFCFSGCLFKACALASLLCYGYPRFSEMWASATGLDLGISVSVLLTVTTYILKHLNQAWRQPCVDEASVERPGLWVPNSSGIAAVLAGVGVHVIVVAVEPLLDIKDKPATY